MENAVMLSVLMLCVTFLVAHFTRLSLQRERLDVYSSESDKERQHERQLSMDRFERTKMVLDTMRETKNLQPKSGTNEITAKEVHLHFDRDMTNTIDAAVDAASQSENQETCETQSGCCGNGGCNEAAQFA